MSIPNLPQHLSAGRDSGDRPEFLRQSRRPIAGAKAPLIAVLVALTMAAALPGFAQDVGGPAATPSATAPYDIFSGALRWRSIGPYRAGRVTSVSGIAGDPRDYYIGTPGGGVWKTTDGGTVWTPISSDIPESSIGVVAVAPSNPKIVYVGTGEQVPGHGVYKSFDAGAHWNHLGLSASYQIPALLVNPTNPSIILVAAQGSPVVAGGERGVYRSTDGGKTFKRVLYRDEKTGAIDLSYAADDPNVVYAALWRQFFQPPPAPGAATPAKTGITKPPQPPVSAVYRSLDGGITWHQVAGHGLPPKAWGRVGIAAAPHTRGRRVFAILSQGLFRSDDGGANWRRATDDPRIVGNGYFSRVFVDPRNADEVFIAQTSLYRSTDGGHHFVAFKGAPGGDDNHVIWIDPRDDRRLILGSDQGPTISVDGGRTWTPWFNLPNGQFYHVTTDNQFPYHVYGAQQDSGTASVLSRSDFGEITDRDWAPVGGFEFGFIAPDPLHPNWVYTAGWYQSIARFDRETGQVVHVFENPGQYRVWFMPPIVFSPTDPHVLYLGTQYLLATSDNGDHWAPISPDLTVRDLSPSQRKPAGMITTIAPSAAADGEIWVGTANGLVQVTRDNGKNWQAVPPSAVPSPIVTLDASALDPGAAYAVLGGPGPRGLSFGQASPRIFRTHDFGRHWDPINTGLPPRAEVTVVRADLKKKGLLFAGTRAHGVFVSFDDGDHWGPLQLNLPSTPITDLTVHGDDLVASTFGRGFWILDDITPLRHIAEVEAAPELALLQPETGWRVRWSENRDTPLPPEVPAGENPPEGALVDYYFAQAPHGDVTLSIYDAQGRLVRQYSNRPEPASPEASLPPNVPAYWFAPPVVLPAHAGLNRFAWDLRDPAPRVLPYGYFGALLKYREVTLPDGAIRGHEPVAEPGPLVLPGTYRLVLTADGKTATQEMTVREDPRIKISSADLQAQVTLDRRLDAGLDASYDTYMSLVGVRQQIEALLPASNDGEEPNPAGDPKPGATKTSPSADPLTVAAQHAAAQLHDVMEGEGETAGVGTSNRRLERLAEMVGTGDAAPADTLLQASKNACEDLDKALAQARDFLGAQLPELNAALRTAGRPTIASPAAPPNAGCGM
jgi:photosystem II stability/assembly factor-like uncharacterized protein